LANEEYKKAFDSVLLVERAFNLYKEKFKDAREIFNNTHMIIKNMDNEANHILHPSYIMNPLK
jgi:hypothetical protein